MPAEPLNPQIIVSDADFDDLLLRLADPAQVNEKLLELIRRTRGSVEHR